MLTDNLRRSLSAVSLTLFASAATAWALDKADFLVSPEAQAAQAGETIYHQGHSYTAGTTAFATLAEVEAAGAQEGCTVAFAPGTWSSSFSVNTKGMTLLGANAWIDSRACDRGSASIITVNVKVNASGVTINGFDFTGAGRVTNTTCSSESPLEGFTFIFNKAYSTTFGRANTKAVVKLGTIYSDATAPTSAAQCQVKDVTIAHNTFASDEPNHHVLIAGAFGATTIEDNRFNTGGQPLRMDNSSGDVSIRHNSFKNIGQQAIDAGASGNPGDFCLSFNRCGYTPSTFDIVSNDFAANTGQGTLYPMIRFFPGDGTNMVTPDGSRVNINFNDFRKKKPMLYADGKQSYNYIYYVNKGHGTLVSDVRFNQCDTTNYCYGFVPLEPMSTANSTTYRVYADQSSLIKPSSTTVKGWHKQNVAIGDVTVMQSFDIDPVTGDLYFIQVRSGSSLSGDPKPLIVSRVPADGSSVEKMTMCWSGHGTNMKIARVDGKVYIFCGGAATMNSAGTETVSQKCMWFPFVAGATIDGRETSFTYGGTTYSLSFFDWDKGTNEYPAVDEANRLFCSRVYTKTDGVVYNWYGVYDLDDVLANGSDATRLAYVKLTRGDNPTSVTEDNGYNTWDHQGYTINGDYLYIMEGISAGSTGTSGDQVSIDGKPTVFVHIYNWRTNKFVHRKQLTASGIINQSFGEVEGCTVRRLAGEDHASLYVAFANGSSGARKMNIYKYGMDDTSVYTKVETPVISTDVSSLTWEVDNTTAVTKEIAATYENLVGYVHPVISGPDQQFFTVTTTANVSPYKRASTVKIKFKASKTQETYTAYLRLSSPMATDVIIPLTAYNSAAITGVESITTTPDATTAPIEYYNLQGIRVASPQPGQILIRRQGPNVSKIKP